MIDQETYSRIQSIIRREGRSFMQYAAESFPWANSEHTSVLSQLLDIVHEEQRSVADLSTYLVKLHLAPPYLGPYPSYFTSYNFLALEKVLSLLVLHQKKNIEDLRTDIASLANGACPPALDAIMAGKTRHLNLLEGLAAAR